MRAWSRYAPEFLLRGNARDAAHCLDIVDFEALTYEFV